MEAFIKYMKINNMRVTEERKTIAHEIFSLNQHFDVESLAAKMREKNISRATVYRTVSMMEKGGLIRKPLHQNGRAIYEHVFRWEPHGHLVCAECGKTEAFHEGIIEKVRDEICPKYDFTPIAYHISVKGWCRVCVHKHKNKKVRPLGTLQ